MVQRTFNYLKDHQIIFALFLIFVGWMLFEIKDIIVSVFLSYIIMASMLPMVDYLKRRKVPKVLAVIIPYFSVVLFFLLLIVPLIPFFTGQIEELLINFPKYLDKSARVFGIHMDAHAINNYLNGQMNEMSKSAFQVTSKVFGGLFSVITVFVVSFYMLMYNDKFKKFIASMSPKKDRERVLETVGLVNDKLGSWLQGQMFLCLAIGTISGIALTLLGIPYALPLALIAGMLEAIPTLGPILSAIPAVIVAITISPTMALVIILTYTLIQMFENQFLVPKVMERAVGLNPVIVILGVAMGAKLLGVIGALLAIPFISLIIVIYNSIENPNS